MTKLVCRYRGTLISKDKNSKAHISKGLNARHCYSKGLCFQGQIFSRGIISKWIDLQGFEFARYSCFQGPISKAQLPSPNFQGPISKPRSPRLNLQVLNFEPLHLSFAAKGRRQHRD